MSKSFDDLYKAFEDRFRGPRELVKERLNIYQPLLAQVPRQAEGPTLAIDLGCGRGEWLEVLAEAGLEAVGVDTNVRMAQEATDNGLKIELQDALEHLSGRPGNSVAVISAFHMVEHVPTDYLIGLLDECRRVLTDDGLLILETPNPENISVGTHTFHLDPTHKSPLPPDLLEFLVEQAGFAETAVLRLNGAPMIEAGPIERSVHLMFEVARDYACLARKNAAAGDKALAGFVQAASQQHPADTGQVKQWLRSADEEIASGGLNARLAELAQAGEAKDAEIGRLHHHIVETDKAHAEERGSLNARLAELAQAGEAKDAEIGRLHHHIVETDKAHAEERGSLNARLAELAQAGEAKDAENSRLHRHIVETDKAHAEERGGLNERLAQLVQSGEEKDAEIGRLRHHIVETDKAHAEERGGLNERLAQVTEARDAEIERLRQHIATAEVAQEQEAVVRERDAEIARLNETVAALAGQVQQLLALTDAFKNSTSWRLSAPLRGMKHLYRAAFGRSKDGSAPNGVRPGSRSARENAKLVMQHGLLWLRLRPRTAAAVRSAVRLAPPLERRLLAFARANSGFVISDTGWALEPDPITLQQWSERLKTGKWK